MRRRHKSSVGANIPRVFAQRMNHALIAYLMYCDVHGETDSREGRDAARAKERYA